MGSTKGTALRMSFVEIRTEATPASDELLLGQHVKGRASVIGHEAVQAAMDDCSFLAITVCLRLEAVKSYSQHTAQANAVAQAHQVDVAWINGRPGLLVSTWICGSFIIPASLDGST